MDEETTQVGEEQALREQAEKRVKDRIELLEHIGVYILVNGFLVIVWGLTQNWSGYPWFIWVMAGWGLGLAIHIVTYIIGSESVARRDRLVEKEVERMKENK